MTVIAGHRPELSRRREGLPLSTSTAALHGQRDDSGALDDFENALQGQALLVGREADSDDRHASLAGWAQCHRDNVGRVPVPLLARAAVPADQVKHHALPRMDQRVAVHNIHNCAGRSQLAGRWGREVLSRGRSGGRCVVRRSRRWREQWLRRRNRDEPAVYVHQSPVGFMDFPMMPVTKKDEVCEVGISAADPMHHVVRRAPRCRAVTARPTTVPIPGVESSAG